MTPLPNSCRYPCRSLSFSALAENRMLYVFVWMWIQAMDTLLKACDEVKQCKKLARILNV